MVHEAVAERYAEAIFEIARENSAVKEWQASLEGMLVSIDSHPFLRKMLYSRQIPQEVKKDVLRKVFSSGLPPQLLSFLFLIVDKGRERFLMHMVKIYHDKVRNLEGTSAASVTVAAPPDPAALAALEKALARYAGKPVKVEFSVDPSIIGGVVVRMEGRILDWSVASHLARLREKMAGVAIG